MLKKMETCYIRFIMFCEQLIRWCCSYVIQLLKNSNSLCIRWLMFIMVVSDGALECLSVCRLPTVACKLHLHKCSYTYIVLNASSSCCTQTDSCARTGLNLCTSSWLLACQCLIKLLQMLSIQACILQTIFVHIEGHTLHKLNLCTLWQCKHDLTTHHVPTHIHTDHAHTHTCVRSGILISWEQLTQTHAHMQAQIHTHTGIYTHVCTQAYIHTCAHAGILHTLTQPQIRVQINTCTSQMKNPAIHTVASLVREKGELSTFYSVCCPTIISLVQRSLCKL